MNEKSHVSLEQRVCIVCRNTYETGALLLDRRSRPSMQAHTTTGWGLCPEHKKLHDDGFIALIECDAEKSGRPAAGSNVRPEDAYPTGVVAYLKRERLGQVFNIPIDPNLPCMFVETGVIDRLKARLNLD